MWSESDGEVHEDRMARSSGGSEVVMIDERALASASNPYVGSLNVTKSSRVQIGPRFVSVTQNVHNNEVIKDLPLHKYLWNVTKNTTRNERLWCSAATVALLICIALIACLTLPKAQETQILDVAPHDWNITREMWLAQIYEYNQTMDEFNPLRLVIIQHTVSPECDRFIFCAAELRSLQSYYLNVLKYDIPYTFLIGNDGRVYEGRGWNKVGAHTYGYNRCSIGIGFIGDYREEVPSHATVTDRQIENTKMLLETGVKLGYLHPDYYIVGAKDLKNSESPGSNLYNAIKNLSHYDHEARYRDMTCEQIHDLYT